MANVYVYSGAGGTGTGADWANAYTTLAAAFTAKAAGDDFWIASDHAESQATAITLTCPGTAAAPCRAISVNRAGSVPPVAADVTAGASITTTATSNITFNGHCYTYGVTFNCGTLTGASSILLASATSDLFFDNCNFKIVGTGATASVTIGVAGNTAAQVAWNNCKLTCAASGQSIVLAGARFLWKNTASALVATVPAVLFKTSSSNRPCFVVVDGVDLSGIGTGVIFDALTSPITAILRDCKIGTSTTVTTPTAAAGGRCDVINCNNGAINYTSQRVWYQGTLTVDTTVTRTGGANDGTNAFNWKVVTTANNKRQSPFECFEVDQWVDTTGSKTVTCHICPTTGVTLTDAEVWMEVFYLGSSTAPLASVASTAPATQLTTASNLTASGISWSGSGLGTPQKLSTSVTVNMKGLLRVKVYVAKASATVYVCPRVEIT